MLSKAKRVEVAKDVLKMLRMRKGIRVRRGVYLDTNNEYAEGDLQKLLEKGEVELQNCEVCARGACLISRARLWDQVVISESMPVDEVLDTTKSDWGRKQAGMIELAFEGRNYVGEELPDCAFVVRKYPKLADKCIAFATEDERREQPKKVLKRIMSNIEANEGVFKP